MLLDRTHRKWALISAIILVIATLTYVVYAGRAPKGPTGGSWMGLMYGIVGSIMMLLAGLLAGRKQVPHWRLGSAQFWLRGHLWLGTLSLPMILFHSGFGLGGRLEQLLWLFFGIVIASGFFGLAMQHLLPKLITTQISRETFVVQLPYLRKRNRLICDKLVSKESTKIPLGEDVLRPQLVALAQHAIDVKNASGAQAKDLKGQWADRLHADNRLLFVEFAKHAKAEKWITREDDFTAHLLEIYDIPGLAQSAPAKVEPAADKPAAATTAASPAAESVAAEKPASDAPAKKLSPLEMMKAKAAAKPADGSAPATSAPVTDAVEPTKKLSPLEMMKAKAAAKLAEGAAPAAAAADAAEPIKKLSPLEQMKAKAAAKAAAAAGTAATESPVAAVPAAEPAKKLSPLEQVRAQAAKKAALASGAAAPASAPLKQVAPAPTAEIPATAPAPAAASGKGKLPPIAATVENVDAELQAVGKLFTEQYGFSEAASTEIVELTRPFLKTSSEPSLAETQHASRTAAPAAAPTASPAPAVVEAPASEPAKKLTPLEIMKQQAAAKKAAAAGVPAAEAPASPAAPAAAEPEKKLSPLEIMKQKAAAKKAAESGATGDAAAPAPTTEAPAKPLSPLEQMKAKAAAKAGGDSAVPAAPGGAPAKPLSPLEMMKAKKDAAAAAAGGEAPAAAPKPAVAPKPPAPKVAPPAPVAIKKAAKTQALRTEELHRFYMKVARPFLNSNGRHGALSNAIDATREFNQMRASLPVELHEALETLQERCDEHRQFASLERIHHWLHYWLALHIPFSIALFVFFIVHVLVALRVVPWSFRL